MKTINKLKLNIQKSGQALIEYLILICLIGVSAIGIIALVGTNIKELYRNVSHSIRGEKNEKYTVPKKSDFEKRGMDNFGETRD